MKVIILGGTGAIGNHLMKILSDKGFDVFVTTRKSKLNHDNITYIEGNALDDNFINSILNQHWDVIVDFMLYSNNQFYKRFESYLKATNQYIFTSSARVYADNNDSLVEESPRLLDVSEDTYFLSIDEYSLNKARQEDMLKKSSFSNWTIIRPYITYSHNRLQLGVFEKEEWLYRVLKGRTIVFPEELKDKYTTLTYGYDVANGISSIINNNTTNKKVFHIANNQAVKWSDVISIYQNSIEKYTGKRPRVKYISLNNFLCFRSENSKYQLLYDRMYNRKFDNTAISKFVDVDSFCDLETGLDKCIKSFLEKGSFSSLNWPHEAMKDRFTSEFVKITEIAGFKNMLRYLKYRFF